MANRQTRGQRLEEKDQDVPVLGARVNPGEGEDKGHCPRKFLPETGRC